MPRQRREISDSGVYHAIIRVTEKSVFEKQKNCTEFIKILKKIKNTTDTEIYAYCIMPDHVHILLKTNEQLPAVFKRLAVIYVRWYNREYKRSGSLFHDRFMSEPIETDSDFLSVIGFIHNNPVKHGLCDMVSDFKFSSYHEYFKSRSMFVDRYRCFRLTDITGFEAIHDNVTQFLEIPKRTFIRKTDEQGNALIDEFVKVKQVERFEYMTLINQHRCITMLKENGFSIRQIHRLTSVPISTIRKL